MTLIEFLEARIADDEALARAAVIDDVTAGNWAVEDGAPDSWIRGLNISAMDSNWDACISTKHAAHVIRWNPSRALAECTAKRAIINEHHPHDHSGDYGAAAFCNVCQWDHNDDAPRIDNQPTDDSFGSNPCATIAHLAAAYAHHSDYQKEWAHG